MDEFLDSENRSPFPVIIGWILVAVAVILGGSHFLGQIGARSASNAATFYHGATFPLRGAALIVGLLAVALFFLSARRFTNRMTTSLNVIAVIALIAGLVIAGVAWQQWQDRLRPQDEYAAIAAKFVPTAQEQPRASASSAGQGWLSRYRTAGVDDGPYFARAWTIPSTSLDATCAGLPQRLAVYGTVTPLDHSTTSTCAFVVHLKTPEPGAYVMVDVVKPTAAEAAALKLVVTAW